MEIEIYLPCRPDIVCDGLLLLFTMGFVVGIILFIWFIYKEYKEVNKKVVKRKKVPNHKK